MIAQFMSAPQSNYMIRTFQLITSQFLAVKVQLGEKLYSFIYNSKKFHRRRVGLEFSPISINDCHLNETLCHKRP